MCALYSYLTLSLQSAISKVYTWIKKYNIDVEVLFSFVRCFLTFKIVKEKTDMSTVCVLRYIIRVRFYFRIRINMSTKRLNYTHRDATRPNVLKKDLNTCPGQNVPRPICSVTNRV